jgi:hypothetical protein
MALSETDCVQAVWPGSEKGLLRDLAQVADLTPLLSLCKGQGLIGLLPELSHTFSQLGASHTVSLPP